MKRKLIAGSLAALAVAGGTAGAIAATNSNRNEERAVLADAARRLGVGTDELRNALSQAQDAHLAAAVKAGRLTQEQADDIKERRAQKGTVLGHRGGPGGPGPGHGGGGGHELVADAAKALGISEQRLVDQLRAGKPPAQIAKAAGKTLAEVKAAVRRRAVARIDADVKAGRITQAQRDEMIEHLDEALDRLEDFRGFRGPGGPGGFGHP